MGRLEIIDADLGAGNVGGNREDRDAAALRIEQAIDQMQVARAATACANSQLPGEMCFSGGRKCGTFLVPHVCTHAISPFLRSASEIRSESPLRHHRLV
jgi:hypothetical protein